MSGFPLVAAVALLAALSGCVATLDRPPDLKVSARWAAWEDEALPHLWLTLRNDGGSPATIGPAGDAVTVTGPTSAVPVHWGTPFSTTLGAGEAVTVVLHPRAFGDDPLGLTLDHVQGAPVRMPPGLYQVCVGAACATTSL